VALRLADELHVRHVVIDANELEIPGFSKNPSNRCYYCKSKLFQELVSLAKEEGIPFIVEGSTLDDDKDHRPGKKAVQELGIRSPLKEANFQKRCEGGL
jgi:uncharacterized protein